MKRNKELPELLSPAGSFECVNAAVAAGADAVYFGMKSFSARSYAQNFSYKEATDAIKYCKSAGVNIYLTINTQLFDSDMEQALEMCRILYNTGVDAFIITDLGLIGEVRRELPDAVLHASTQMSPQNIYSAEVLSRLGFTRMVVPRECSRQELIDLCEKSKLEIEAFIHGANCVCHSGQCLMSAVIGPRSGNKGNCAQPCRMAYRGATEYPLSLKDNCLAPRMKDLIDMGVSSLKIEGRMKSADYVYGVTKIYRKLLDERRDADESEVKELADLFSRSGFTTGYFDNKVDSNMLGIRTREDKIATSESTDKTTEYPKKRIYMDMTCIMKKGMPITLTGIVKMNGRTISATAEGREPEVAITYPMNPDLVKKQLIRLGNSSFETDPDKIVIDMDGDVMMPVMLINQLRRDLCEEMEKKIAAGGKTRVDTVSVQPLESTVKKCKLKTAYFDNIKSITPEAFDYFDKIFVPLEDYCKVELSGKAKLGVCMPNVVMEGEENAVLKELDKAVKIGCSEMLVTNMWQIDAAEKRNMHMTADLKMNCMNSYSCKMYSDLGFDNVILSVETGLPKAADMKSEVDLSVVAYGRIPVMTLEKCAIRDILGMKGPKDKCEYCKSHDYVSLTDSKNMTFKIKGNPVTHRNTIFNSVPVWTADIYNRIYKLGLGGHYIFTDESAEQVKKVINSYIHYSLPEGQFRRI